VLGISTGGPQALARVFRDVAPPAPPILVVQHMPARFTQVFAERLDRASPVSVKQAEEGDRVKPNRVLIAPGGRHMAVTGNPTLARVVLSEGPPVSGHRPSVDVLFRSAAATFGAATVGVIMTGMGQDGVEGCLAVLAAGGRTLGQDETTSVVYGMNKAAFQRGAVNAQFALDELPAILRRLPVFADQDGDNPRGG
jgi:two-component system chemotaxis response regulator CheB